MKPPLVSPARKLEILKSCDLAHTWSSLDDTRCCMICGHTFDGHAASVACSEEGNWSAHCPTRGCSGTHEHWLKADPLSSDEAWEELLRMVDSPANAQIPHAVHS